MVSPHPSERGMTAIETIVALAIFAVLLLILTSLQIQFLAFEQQAELELFDHPQRLAVLERLRSDVQDAVSYPALYQQWVQNTSTLILRKSPSEVVVWSFGPSRAERLRWVDDLQDSRWTALAVPRYEIEAAHGAPGRTGVRLRGFNDDEDLIFDQIIFPRAR